MKTRSVARDHIGLPRWEIRYTCLTSSPLLCSWLSTESTWTLSGILERPGRFIRFEILFTPINYTPEKIWWREDVREDLAKSRALMEINRLLMISHQTILWKLKALYQIEIGGEMILIGLYEHHVMIRNDGSQVQPISFFAILFPREELIISKLISAWKCHFSSFVNC